MDWRATLTAVTSRTKAGWARHGGWLSGAGVAYLAIAAVGRLSYALPRLVGDVEPWSAIDLKYRFREVEQWFSGGPVYGVLDGAVYPPASYVVLWPFIGWGSLDTARLSWAVLTVAGAATIAAIAYRLCSPARPRYRLLVAGLAFASYPVQMSIFVGQVGVWATAFALAAAYLLQRPRPRTDTDLLAGFLLACALVKPTVTLPILAAILISARRSRPWVLCGLFYVAFTFIAASFQPADTLSLIREWLSVSTGRVSWMEGAPNLQMLLAQLGLMGLMMPTSLLVLALATAWLWRRKKADPWVLLGAGAIVARFWTHSRLYDDAILLLPVIALFRMATAETERRRGGIGLVLAGAWAALLTPTWFYYDLGPVFVRLVHVVQTMLWLGVLVLLVAHAHRSEQGPASSG